LKILLGIRISSSGANNSKDRISLKRRGRVNIYIGPRNKNESQGKDILEDRTLLRKKGNIPLSQKDKGERHDGVLGEKSSEKKPAVTGECWGSGAFPSATIGGKAWVKYAGDKGQRYPMRADPWWGGEKNTILSSRR